MHTNFRRRVLSASIAVTTGVVVALGASTVALADTSASNIDPTQTGTLIFHKYEQPDKPTNIISDGADHSNDAALAGLTPLPEVTFTVERLTGYDLTTNAGWASLSGLTVAGAQAASKDKAIVFDPTGTDGTSAKSGLPLGVYLVTESGYPAGVTPAAPFLVTLPLTDPENLDNWLYVVNVYPKNSTSTVTKTVDDSKAYKLGDTVTWTILGDIPDLPDTNDEIAFYRVEDPLDERLDYTKTTVSLVGGELAAPLELVKGTDYTVTPDAPKTAAGGAVTVTVDFLEPGLEKLIANSTSQVQVVIDTTVNSVGADGAVENKAYVYPNEASTHFQPGEPGGPAYTEDPTITKFGNVTLKKVEAGKSSELLEGAVFQVFRSEADAISGNEPISINTQNKWTTGANGEVTISGLRQSGWYNGHEVAAGTADYQYYWVAEVSAPEGYSLLAQPVRVTVGDVDQVVDFTIEDALKNGGFPLPMTGGTLSTCLFYGLGGAILLSVAIVLIARARRRDEVVAE